MKWIRNSRPCGAELYNSPTGRTSRRVLRKMGYKADNRGIIDRFIQANGAWEGHLQKCRAFIMKAVSGKTIEKLAVYGSGWCLDLPLDELAGSVGNIYLYDLVHPPQVVRRIRKRRNITLIHADISGGAVMRAYQAVKRYRKDHQKIPPDEICSQTFHPQILPDFCISLNVLSQVGVMITDYLKEHVPYVADEIARMGFLLQQAHLQLLTPGKSCLITDVRELSYDLTGRLVQDIEILQHPLPSAERTESWDWQFDEQGGYKPQHKTVFRIMAMEL